MLNPYEGGEFRVSQSFTLGTHNGLDIVGRSSKRLVALCDAVVYRSRIVTDRSNLTWQWGNYVTLKAKSGELITYAHLSRRLVSEGQEVKKGEAIGIEGNTGYSFGSHCHLEVRAGNNRVTEKVNTVSFTDIPNAVGSYTAEQEEEMNEAQIKELIDARVNAMAEQYRERVYHYWSQLPLWAHDPIMALYKKGYFAGKSSSDLDLSEGTMRTLVVLARALKADGKIEY